MRPSSDIGHFFQTDSALSESKRKSQKAKNEAGEPIRLQSKLLAVIADPFHEDAAYVAEAAGTIRRIVLETRSVSHTLRPSTSSPRPFTSLAIVKNSSTSATLFAGSWDKNIYAWPIERSVPSISASTSTLTGHTDFVKALNCVPASTSHKRSDALLVSASADKSIIVWNAQTFERLHTLTGHARGVQALALDPLSIADPLVTTSQQHEEGVVVASGDSNREIRFWRISSRHAKEISSKEAAEDLTTEPDSKADQEGAADEHADVEPLIAHETSIFDLAYSDQGDLWTASADRSSKQLARARNFAQDETLTHTDYVKAVIVVESTLNHKDQPEPVVVTGCRDEDVRVWDVGSGICIARLQGHYEEVTGLARVRNGQAVVSVSIDGTVRTWGLSQQKLQRAIATFEARDERKDTKSGVALTEDEERELAELMDDDD